MTIEIWRDEPTSEVDRGWFRARWHYSFHSVSVDNELGVATGWNDGELSGERRRLAVGLGERHRAAPSGSSSPQTSDARSRRPIRLAPGIPVHRDTWSQRKSSTS